MAIEFSLINGVTPPFVPDMETLLKYKSGDFDISDKIQNKMLNNLNNTSNMNNAEKNILNRNSKNDGNGLKSIEKTFFQSLLEITIPPINLIGDIGILLSTLEDVCARTLGLIDNSKNPLYNKNSLTYKLFRDNKSLNNIEKSNNISEKNQYSGYTTKQKQDGIPVITSDLQTTFDINKYTWATVSISYSTGIKYDNINYLYKYIYQFNNNTQTINNKSIDLKQKFNITEEKPNTIIFGVYNSDGIIVDFQLPTFIEKNPKFFKNLLVHTASDTEWKRIDTKQEYLNTVSINIKNKLNSKNQYSVDVFNNIYKNISDGMDNDIFNTLKYSGFFGNINNGFDFYGGDRVSLGNDINKIVKDARSFLPQEILYKGKQILIDPEADYYLQIIKFEGISSDKITDNKRLNVIEPYTSMYQNKGYSDILKGIDNNLTSKYADNLNISNKVEKVHHIFYQQEYSLNSLNEKTNPTKPQSGNPYFYIVEGILKTDDKDIQTKLNDSNLLGNKNNTSGTEFYKKYHFATAIPILISSLIIFETELIPKIESVLDYLIKPQEKILDSITDKTGKNFDFMSSNIRKKYSKLKNMNLSEKYDFLDSNTDLKKYVSIQNGKETFIMNSGATINLLGINFGLIISDAVPKFIISKTPIVINKTNSMMKTILSLLVLPVKILKKAIDFIVDLFKSLNIKNIVSKLNDLVSFKFLTDLISPENILKLLGITLSLETLELFTNTPKGIFDLNQIFSAAFLSHLPPLTKSEFKIITEKGGDKFLSNIKSFYDFFAEIINKIIDFIASMFGLDNKKRTYLDNKKLNEIYKKFNEQISSTILYTIQLPSGEIIPNQTKTQVDEFVKNNVEFSYVYK